MGGQEIESKASNETIKMQMKGIKKEEQAESMEEEERRKLCGLPRKWGVKLWSLW